MTAAKAHIIKDKIIGYAAITVDIIEEREPGHFNHNVMYVVYNFGSRNGLFLRDGKTSKPKGRVSVSEFFDGKIDDDMFYNTLLSINANEIGDEVDPLDNKRHVNAINNKIFIHTPMMKCTTVLLFIC